MNESFEKMLTVMSIDRSRRRWRLVGITLFIFLLFMVIGKNSSHDNKPLKTPHIAQVHFDGMILDTRHVLDTLKNIESSNNAKAVIAHINSPGGSMVGGLNVYRSLRRISEKKPVTIVMEETAASAGYLIALGGDYIVANEATLTGSIGVFMPLFDATSLAEKIGVKSTSIASGDMKLSTSPVDERSAKATQHLSHMVNQLEDIFIHHVKERRNISSDVEKTIRDGRALIGVQALEFGLIDALGDASQAKTWLEKTYNLPQSLPVAEYSFEEPQTWLESLLSQASLLPTWLKGMHSQGILAVQF